MRAIKARFDGERIILPAEVGPGIPGEVIVIFQEAAADEKDALVAAQQAAFGRVWDNAEDGVYDEL